MNRPLWNLLTKREQSLLGWLKTGLTYKEIAAQVGLGPDYLKVIVSHVIEKLGANNRLHAVVMLLEEKFAAEKQELVCTAVR